jgi:DNA-binding GntR family transcriptional regulator
MESRVVNVQPGLVLKGTPFRGRLAEEAYQRLKKAIETNDLAPGSVIFERDLVNQFQMSRTPLREALQRLSNEGYLQQFHRGYGVVEVTDQEIINAYAVRGMLEGMAARQAAAARRRVDIARLQDVYDKEKLALSSGESDAALAMIIEEFHEVLGESSSNDLLQSVLKVARVRTEPFRRRRASIPGLLAADVEDHRAIIQAIEAGQAFLAELSLRVLIRRTIRELTGHELANDAEMADVLEYVKGKAARQD